MIEFFFDEAKSIQYDKNRFISHFDSGKAVEYARKYALTYNPEYRNFSEIGGDCSNFISQCLKFGGIPTSETWRPYSNSWVRVNDLKNFLVYNGYAKEIPMTGIFKAGNIIQFFSDSKGYYAHSGIITKALSSGDYLYCCHSYDKLDYPLSFIYPFFYNKFRVLDIVY